MIDISSEQIFPLASPPPWLIGRAGKPVHRTTLERWAKVGVRGGIKLETALLGATRVSSVEAVERFMARLNGHAPTPDQSPAPTVKAVRSPNQRRKASESALARLEKAGYSAS